MRFAWLSTPALVWLTLIALPEGAVRADTGDQLASLAVAGAHPRMLFRAKEAPIDLAYDVRRVRPAVGSRLGPGSFPAPDRTASSIDSLGLPLDGSGAVLDLYPFRDGFRVSAGARSDLSDARFMNRFRRSLAESDSVIAATLTGEDDGFTPYLGIGYARRMMDGRLELAVDAGLLFDRGPDSHASDGTAAALAVEDDAGGGADAGSSEIYPVVGFSMKYRF